MFYGFGQPPTNLNTAFVKLGHDCNLQADDDYIMQVFPRGTLCASLKRAFVKSILVNEKICRAAATSSMSIRSHSSIRSEIRRQLDNYTYTIHPFSAFRFYWDILMILVVFVQIILVCLDLAFFWYTESHPFFNTKEFLIVRTVFDVISCWHIIVCARTGFYYDIEKEFVLNSKECFKHYLRNGFWFDLITSIPTHHDLFWEVDRGDGTQLQLLYAMHGISSFKILKYIFVHSNVERIAKTYNMDYYIRNVLLIAMGLIICWLGLSCFMLYGYVVLDDQVNINAYRNTTGFEAIARILYDGALILHTNTYGVFPPGTVPQYLITTFQWFIAKGLQIYLLAKILSILKARNSPKMKYSQMVKQIVEFMRHKHLPLHTQRRILNYYEYHFQKCYFRENDIYSTISGQLRQDIMMQTCRNLVQNVEFFHDIPISLLVRIVNCLKSDIYLANDLILKSGSVGNCMYFIATGTVAIYTSSMREVCHLEDGAYFGEIALVSEDHTRIANVLAVETCQLFRLDKKDFVKAIYPYPDLLEKIQKVAIFRVETTAMFRANDGVKSDEDTDSSYSARITF